MSARMKSERGWAVVTAMAVMAIMIAVALAMFAWVDSEARLSGKERSRESAFDYAEGVLDTEAFIMATNWPGASPGMADCTYNGIAVVAAGGGGNVNLCPSQTQVAQAFTAREFQQGVIWTARVRDNGGTDKCVLTGAMQCSYYYDDSALTNQPSWDANGDGQVWVRAQALMGNVRRTVVERVQLDKQTVSFPGAVITSNHLIMSGSPHQKVVTNFTPINLRCAINSANCPSLNTKKQVAPYQFNYSYPQQQAIPTSSLNLLRQRAQKEGWYYATCPTNPPGQQVFVESGTCHGNSLPYTSPTQRGTYIQVTGTLTLDQSAVPNSAQASQGRKGNYWGLIYLANSSKINGDVFKVTIGKRLIQGVVAVDWTGDVDLQGNKNSVLQYDPFVIQGLYLYQGSTLVRPSFREIQTSTP